MSSDGRPTLLIFSQVYVPDPASVGQHMADAAAEMVRRGWRVVVFTSARGYDDPSQRYPAREVRDGVEIRRLPLSSFGKDSIPRRLVGGFSFMAQCIVRGLFTRGVGCVLVSTSPPMCALAALVVAALRRIPMKYWVMDLNPDQMIELGRITERSPSARIFNVFNRIVLRRAADVVALDRFMADRLNRKVDVSDKLTILPPWPHEDHLDSVRHVENPFRQRVLNERAGLSSSPATGAEGGPARANPEPRIIMYSGNHGLTMPLNTVLEAARRLRDRDGLLFMFIGGGVRKKEVNDFIATHSLPNARSLPYQPLSEIRWSLSSADVHLVSMGDEVVGVVHPCKVYGAMAVGRPILLLGPDPCHVADILNEHEIGWRIRHGDVEGMVRVLEEIAATPQERLEEMGRRARELVATRYGKEHLLHRFCDVVERGVNTKGSGVREKASRRQHIETSSHSGIKSPSRRHLDH